MKIKICTKTRNAYNSNTMLLCDVNTKLFPAQNTGNEKLRVEK